MRWRRAIVLPLLLTLSCGRHAPPRPVDVVFWQRWPVEAMRPLVERFEAANPGLHVRVERLPLEGATDSLVEAFQAGRAPDLVELDAKQAARFIDQGWLSDWSAGVADLKSSLRGWELASLGDALYGLPWLLRTRVLYFNRVLFARAGLDSSRGPETWDQLKAAAARVQRLGNGAHGYGMPVVKGERFSTYMPFAWGNGGELFSARLDSTRFASPENIDALEFLVSLEPSSLLADRDSLAREFVRGRLGMLIADAGLSAEIPRDDPGFPIGVALVPRPARVFGRHASSGTGSLLASFTRSHRKEDALRLARFLAGRSNAFQLAASLDTVFPAWPGADSAGAYAGRADAQVFLEQLASTHFEPIVRDRERLWAGVDSLLGEAIARRCSPGHAIEAADSVLRTIGAGR